MYVAYHAFPKVSLIKRIYTSIMINDLSDLCSLYASFTDSFNISLKCINAFLAYFDSKCVIQIHLSKK